MTLVPANIFLWLRPCYIVTFKIWMEQAYWVSIYAYSVSVIAIGLRYLPKLVPGTPINTGMPVDCTITATSLKPMFTKATLVRGVTLTAVHLGSILNFAMQAS